MSTKVTDHSLISATKNHVSADLSGETAILNLSDGVYYGLDRVASRIWSLLQSPTTIEAVRETILSEYDVDREQCTRDLYALVDELMAHGLLNIEHA